VIRWFERLFLTNFAPTSMTFIQPSSRGMIKTNNEKVNSCLVERLYWLPFKSLGVFSRRLIIRRSVRTPGSPRRSERGERKLGNSLYRVYNSSLRISVTW
jgi:hypothetical protein